MTVLDEHDNAAESARYCPGCGQRAAVGARYCRECGHPLDALPADAEAPTIPQQAPPHSLGSNPSHAPTQAALVGSPPFRGPAAADLPPQPKARPQRAWIAAAIVLCLAVVAVAVVVLANSGASDQAKSYRHELVVALAPVTAANTGLSFAVQSLKGTNTSAAIDAAQHAQQAVVAARSAVAVINVPTGSRQRSEQVQQALADENLYLQAVSVTLTAPSTRSIGRLEPLATGVQSTLLSLAGVAPGLTASLRGTDSLSSWASARVAAADKAHAAQQRAAQRRALKQAAAKAAQQGAPSGSGTSVAQQGAPSGSSSPTGSSGPSNPGYGVQDLPVQCGFGVAGSAGMTCAFANNAFYEYWNASGENTTLNEFIDVWSTEGQAYYPLSCFPGDGVVDCTGQNSRGIPLDARFSQGAVSAYTSSAAATYASSGKLGPNG